MVEFDNNRIGWTIKTLRLFVMTVFARTLINELLSQDIKLFNLIYLKFGETLLASESFPLSKKYEQEEADLLKESHFFFVPWLWSVTNIHRKNDEILLANKPLPNFLLALSQEFYPIVEINHTLKKEALGLLGKWYKVKGSICCKGGKSCLVTLLPALHLQPLHISMIYGLDSANMNNSEAFHHFKIYLH